MASVKSYNESEMEGEPANEEKPSDEEWPLERAEVGIYKCNCILICRVRHMLHKLEIS